MDDLIVLLKVLDLLHDLFENFGAVLWRIAVFYKADLDLQLQLIADVLIVQPVSKRRFGIDDLFDLLRQSLALVVDDNTVNLFIGSVSSTFNLRTERTHSLRKQCFRLYKNTFCVAKCLLGSAPNPFDLHFPMQAARPGGTLFTR